MSGCEQARLIDVPHRPDRKVEARCSCAKSDPFPCQTGGVFGRVPPSGRAIPVAGVPRFKTIVKVSARPVNVVLDPTMLPQAVCHALAVQLARCCPGTWYGVCSPVGQINPTCYSLAHISLFHLLFNLPNCEIGYSPCPGLTKQRHHEYLSYLRALSSHIIFPNPIFEVQKAIPHNGR